MRQNIGFIGLGIMGRPMALNLVKAGYPLWVYSPRPESTAPLAEAGATACYTPAEVAENSDVIFIMVRDTDDVEQVVMADNGILVGARAGSTVVDMSTIAAVATRRLAEQLAQKHVDMLDAPVSGGEQGAIEGTLSIMVGGKSDVFLRIYPLLQVLGERIIHIGDHGAGQVAKACNQIVVAQTINAVGEALLLAKACGVDAAAVRNALLGGFAGSKILEVHGKRMLDSDYKPGFKAELHQKDMRIALETAQQSGLALPGAALAAQWLNALVGAGKGALDSSALFTLQEQLNHAALDLACD